MTFEDHEKELLQFMNKQRSKETMKELETYISFLIQYNIDLKNNKTLSNFCQYAFENLRGSNLPSELAKKHKVSLNRKKGLKFDENVKIQKISKIMSQEGKRQQLRESKTLNLTNTDPYKKFIPRKGYEQVTRNETTMVNGKLIKKLELEETVGLNKLLNTITYTLEEIIENPQILNRYGK
ncbi:hypothetical protein NUSPORA_01637 [Nucleospora cyclopteri]